MVNSGREWDWMDTDWVDGVDIRPLNPKKEDDLMIED